MRRAFLAFGLLAMTAAVCEARALDNTDRPQALNKSTNYLPKWSPDGSKIVYCSGRDNQYEIYAMNSDGSKVVRLTRLVYP